MSGLQFFVAVFPVLIPVAILILIFSIIQIIKDRYFYDYFWNERFKEKAKRLIDKTICLKEYKNIRKHFSESTGNIIIKENRITRASKYAVRSVDFDMFRNFIISGKATLYVFNESLVLEQVREDDDFDIYKAVIGICRTTNTGLVFYPASKKEYCKTVGFLRKWKKQQEKERRLIQEIRDLQVQQENDAINNKRMQQFISEFAKENTQIAEQEEPEIFVDNTHPTIPTKPELRL